MIVYSMQKHSKGKNWNTGFIKRALSSSSRISNQSINQNRDPSIPNSGKSEEKKRKRFLRGDQEFRISLKERIGAGT